MPSNGHVPGPDATVTAGEAAADVTVFVGHRDLLVTHTILLASADCSVVLLTRSVRRTSGFVLVAYGDVVPPLFQEAPASQLCLM